MPLTRVESLRNDNPIWSVPLCFFMSSISSHFSLSTTHYLQAFLKIHLRSILVSISQKFQPALEFAIARTIISVAPTSVNSSITVAIFFFSTIELTATQPSSSNALIVGARLPGVNFVASWSLVLCTLYWQRTYF
jgi:hypothetical protein